MRARRSRSLVVLLVVVLAFYFFLIGAGGIGLLGDHRWSVKGLGLGVLLLPLVGVVIVVNELRFGRDTERLARLLEDPDAADPADPLDPDAAFDLRKAEVQAAPQDWRSWYRLAVAYGDARDASRGRRTMRRAIALQRDGERADRLA
jgi:cytochrome c-type biogenesis protein CcmH/NrfG